MGPLGNDPRITDYESVVITNLTTGPNGIPKEIRTPTIFLEGRDANPLHHRNNL